MITVNIKTKNKQSKFTLNLIEMKRKGDISSFFSPKTKKTPVKNDESSEQTEREAQQQESDRVDGRDDQGHDEVEGGGKEQQESVSDEVEGRDDQGDEEVEGEEHRDEKMEEGEHHREEVREGESDKQDEVLSSDSEGEPLQDISSRAGPHGIVLHLTRKHISHNWTCCA